jgi:hypothetical protein
MQRITLGDFELTAVSDGIYHLDGGGMFGVVPKSLWERKVKADANNLVPVGLNSVVVRTGSQTVLIETGVGNKLSERMIKIYGQPAELLDRLAEAGVAVKREPAALADQRFVSGLISFGQAGFAGGMSHVTEAVRQLRGKAGARQITKDCELAFVHFREPSPVSPALLRFRISLTDGLRLSDDATFSLSPDGRTIAFPASRDGEKLRIWVQTLDSLESHPIPGTGGSAGWFWSPDSKTIVFFSDGKLKKSDLAGNVTQTLCEAPGLVLGGDWNKSGALIFGTVAVSGILRVPAEGGVPVSVTKVDESRQERHIFPAFLPDGQHFIYLRNSPLADVAGIYIGSLGVAPEAQPSQRLLATTTAARPIASPTDKPTKKSLRDRARERRGTLSGSTVS